MRMDIFENNKFKIINDSYNANPDSMKAALKVLKESAGNHRKVAILEYVGIGQVVRKGPL